jgi:ABC-type uncharacterized transport system ATPase subunit
MEIKEPKAASHMGLNVVLQQFQEKEKLCEEILLGSKTCLHKLSKRKKGEKKKLDA